MIRPCCLVADAEVLYEGRASSVLERGRFMVLIKPDLSIAVHGSKFKPLNYQRAKSDIVVYRSGGEFTDLWQAMFKKKPRFIVWSSNRGETLAVAVYKVHSHQPLTGLSDNKIVLAKSEQDLVDQLIKNVDTYLPNIGIIKIIQQQHTPYGAIDVLVVDAVRTCHIIEVKRAICGVSAVSQVLRYGSCLRKKGLTVMEYLASPRLSKNASVYCQEHDIGWMNINFQ